MEIIVTKCLGGWRCINDVVYRALQAAADGNEFYLKIACNDYWHYAVQHAPGLCS